MVTTAITATAASIGAAGIPQAGLVTMVSVGLCDCAHWWKDCWQFCIESLSVGELYLAAERSIRFQSMTDCHWRCLHKLPQGDGSGNSWPSQWSRGYHPLSWLASRQVLFHWIIRQKPPWNVKARVIINLGIFQRFRTAINVLGDSLGAGLVAHLSRKEIELAREEEEDDKSARAEKLRR